MVAKNSILVVGRFQKKKIFGKYYKKNLRQYILQYCHCKSLTSSRWFTSFFVGYYTVKLIGSVVYCLNIFRPKLSCENVLACHMPDKHMPSEFLPAFLLTNLSPPPSLRQSIFCFVSTKGYMSTQSGDYFSSQCIINYTQTKTKKILLKVIHFVTTKRRKKTVTNSLI